MEIKVYHNPRCSKSRCAIQYLEEKGQEFEVIEYLKSTPTKKELKEILSKLGISAHELIRVGEQVYKESFKGRNLSEDEWIEAMIQYPKLIERPIIVKGDRAVIARPLENLDDLV